MDNAYIVRFLTYEWSIFFSVQAEILSNTVFKLTPKAHIDFVSLITNG